MAPHQQTSGWFEEQTEEVRTSKGIKKKAPIHRIVAIKKEASKANNTPMRKETKAIKTYKPRGYWTYDTTLSELKNVIAQIGHFPKQQELSKLASAMEERGVKG